MQLYKQGGKKSRQKVNQTGIRGPWKLEEVVVPVLSYHAQYHTPVLDSLEKNQGLLVEEKAPDMASRQFGEDFSRPFLIKSVHNLLVKLIANANMTKLPKDD
eukprot:scaffold456_cov171-Amphora_coffeaeformis.AAC.3